ncbi:FMN-binding negative transcriptional regulator [Devosia sp.]|uniref:FMN-binding negative transcriptional regulator n=1 Tax=Devosia sp. TaxID=1871048 RepID=UPI003BAD524C
MYQPPHFRETDLDTQHGLIVSHPLGLLISTGADGILANPIPFILYAAEGPLGTLRCHMSRANAQWQALQQSPEALIVFQGTDHYITPSWYAQKAIDHKVVPTWNYAIVQARGTAKIIEDAAWLHANVSALTAQHEGHRPTPWAVTDAPEAFIASQLKGIVGIEIAITHLEGKFKASQNRPVADRYGVAEGLGSEPAPQATAMRDLVKQRGGL